VPKKLAATGAVPVVPKELSAPPAANPWRGESTPARGTPEMPKKSPERGGGWDWLFNGVKNPFGK
jgi:hypothetical protein